MKFKRATFLLLSLCIVGLVNFFLPTIDVSFIYSTPNDNYFQEYSKVVLQNPKASSSSSGSSSSSSSSSSSISISSGGNGSNNINDERDGNINCKGPCHGELHLTNTITNSTGIKLDPKVENLRLGKHHFNIDLSERIPLNRVIPDTRSQACLAAAAESYPAISELPTTSVIFAFWNEPLTTLWRSIISVLTRTPEHILIEIILVDDGSTADWLKMPLQEFVASHPKLRLIRLPNQVGLMGARQAGADIATGDTLTFLDSHIEVNNGWLEPLMETIKNDPNIILFPVIDSIHWDTFEYSNSVGDSPHIVGFRWDMFMTWSTPSSYPTNKAAPIMSPAMPGGLFTVDREWWSQLGGYDTGMSIWGGENMELGFRAWLCGGKMAVHPCSHIGHVFQDGHAYDIPAAGLKKNQLRVAKIWMDDYAAITYGMLGEDMNSYDVGDISDMMLMKERNECKSFDYFLDTVFMTGYRWDLVVAGSMSTQMNPNLCLDIKNFGEDKNSNDDLIIYPCHGTGVQFHMINKRGEIVHQGKVDFCLDYNVGKLSFYQCHGMRGNQEWYWNDTMGQIKHSVSGLCLGSNALDMIPSMEPCDITKTNQKWIWNEQNNSSWKSKLDYDRGDVNKESIDVAFIVEKEKNNRLT